jgi:hypothetical protein
MQKMNDTDIIAMVSEKNWMIRLWLGGSLYSPAPGPRPEPVDEAFIESDPHISKSNRDTHIDLMLLDMLKVQSKPSRRTLMLKLLREKI